MSVDFESRRLSRPSTIVVRANAASRESTINPNDIYDLHIPMHKIDTIKIHQETLKKLPLSEQVLYIVKKQHKYISSLRINQAPLSRNSLNVFFHLNKNNNESIKYNNDIKHDSFNNFTKMDEDHTHIIIPHNCADMDEFVLTESSTKRAIWDIVVLFLLLYTLIYLPLRVAFGDDNIALLDVIIDILFILDIIVSFFVSYRDVDGIEITHFSQICMQYIKTWLILDIIASFPYYLFTSSSLGKVGLFIRLPRLLRMTRLVRLIKLLRAYRLKKFFEKIEYSPKVHQGWIRILKLFTLIICFGHFSACLWFFVGDLTKDFNGLSWIMDFNGPYGGIHDESKSKQYITSLYFSISTIATVGFGDLYPQNYIEMIYCICIILFGAILFSYITATISSVIQHFDYKAKLYRTKMDYLLTIIRTSNISPGLRYKLVNEMSLKWKQQNSNNYHLTLRDELPRMLLYEVSLDMHSELINKSKFFNIFKDDIKNYVFIGDIIAEMKPEFAFDGEFIAHCDEPVNYWGIIKHGSIVGISPLNIDIEFMLWCNGDSMGEVGIFLTQNWPWNMRSTSDTSYFIINTSNFLSVLSHHHIVSKKLIRLARTRVKRINRIKKIKALREKKNKAKQKKLKQLQQLIKNKNYTFKKQFGHEYAWWDDMKVAKFKRKWKHLLVNSTPKDKWKYIRFFIQRIIKPGPDKSANSSYINDNSDDDFTDFIDDPSEFRECVNEIISDMKMWRKGFTEMNTHMPNMDTNTHRSSVSSLID